MHPEDVWASSPVLDYYPYDLRRAMDLQRASREGFLFPDLQADVPMENGFERAVHQQCTRILEDHQKYGAQDPLCILSTGRTPAWQARQDTRSLLRAQTEIQAALALAVRNAQDQTACYAYRDGAVYGSVAVGEVMKQRVTALQSHNTALLAEKQHRDDQLTQAQNQIKALKQELQRSQQDAAQNPPPATVGPSVPQPPPAPGPSAPPASPDQSLVADDEMTVIYDILAKAFHDAGLPWNLRREWFLAFSAFDSRCFEGARDTHQGLTNRPSRPDASGSSQ